MTTATDTNREIMARAVAAFIAGDVPALSQVLSPDIVWHVPGRALGNDYKGFDAFMGFIGKLMELSGGTFAVQNAAILANEGGGVYIDQLTADRKGKKLDMPLLLRVAIRDGRMVEAWEHFYDTNIWDDFWAVRVQDPGTE